METEKKTATLFQFTPLREGRQHGSERHKQHYHFNSRPSARGDARACAFALPHKLISIHAPPRGATIIATFSALKWTHFNSRPSARGDFCPGAYILYPPLFQFTPLREGRHFLRVGHNLPVIISIHAPPRGATHNGFRKVAPVIISIHAPPRGATGIGTHRKDCEQISIHAPPRGATRHSAGGNGNLLHFNSRPSARGDGMERQQRQRWLISIHAPPRGATWNRNAAGHHQRFQFTPLREGRHPLHECNTEGIFISIHAPPRGATHRRRKCRAGTVISIHAPPRGATLAGRRRGTGTRHFNSRPSARGDITGGFVTDDDGTFQFTPLREGRPSFPSSEALTR